MKSELHLHSPQIAKLSFQVVCEARDDVISAVAAGSTAVAAKTAATANSWWGGPSLVRSGMQRNPSVAQRMQDLNNQSILERVARVHGDAAKEHRHEQVEPEK